MLGRGHEQQGAVVDLVALAHPHLAHRAGRRRRGRGEDCVGDLGQGRGIQGAGAGFARISFRNAHALYEGPYEVLRWTFDRLGNREAAKEAGVTPAAVYRHFQGREDLIAEAALQGYAIFGDLMQYAFDKGQPSALAAFEATGRAYLAFARKSSVRRRQRLRGP